MKINVELRVSINTGAGLLIWVASFFGLLWMAQHHESIERIFPVALTGLTGALITFVIKRNSNNKIDLEAKRLEFTNGKTGGPIT